MHRKKILVVSPYPPFPPKSGGRMRMFSQIERLCAVHEVEVLYNAFSPNDLFDTALSQTCSKVHASVYSMEMAGIANPIPPSIAWGSPGSLMATAMSLPHHFDLCICHHLHTAPIANLMQCPCILEEHNIESELYLRSRTFQPWSLDHRPLSQSEQTEIAALKEFESQMWPKFDLRITVSERDRQAMLRVADERVEVIENFVKVGDWTKCALAGKPVVLFTGTLDYSPNIDGIRGFCEFVWPIVLRSVPDAVLLVAGANPGDEIWQLARQDSVQIIADPSEMESLFQSAQVSIAPIFAGGGTRIKILEAFAHEVAVVTTSLGCEGLPVENGRELLISDSIDGFSESVVNLILNGSLQREIAANGRRWVALHHDRSLILDRYERVILSLLQPGLFDTPIDL